MRHMMIAMMLVAMTGCGMLDELGLAKPTAEVVGAQVQDVSLTATTLLFDVEVTNPYSTDLPLSNADYTLASDGVQFLSGVADMQGAIPANGSKTLGLPVQVDFLELMRATDGVTLGSTVPYEADLGLSVDAPLAGTMRLPMSRTGELQIPSRDQLTIEEAVRYAREYLGE